MSKGCSKVVKLVIGLHNGSFKVVEFIMKIHHGSREGSEANVDTSPHGFSHLCKSMSG